MQLPEAPPSPADLLKDLSPTRALELLMSRRGTEVEGKYLHWDEIRRRPAPDGLNHAEWWLFLSRARQATHTALPLHDKEAQPFVFSRSDSLQRLLHQVDRELGGPLEVTEPQLANREHRDRYMIQSLMEEAITSSQIEGASTTRKAAKEMLRSGRAPRTKDEQMILNNFRAMEWVRARFEEPLSVDFLFELHRILAANTMEPEEIGRLRRADEHITVHDVADGVTLHIPPLADELPARMTALCAFANETRDDAFIHPVIRAIALHFMLAYDHPFVDGNGRTARALFYWEMLRQKYWLTEFISISRIIRGAKAQYARAFLYSETDSGDLTYFLLHQLNVIRQAVEDLRKYLKSKAAEIRDTERLLRDGEAFNFRQRALITHALRHPDFAYTIEWYRRENNVVYQTARQDLLSLAKAGVLTKRKAGRAFVFDVPADLERRLKDTKRPRPRKA